MGGATCITFVPGDRPVADLKADVVRGIDRVDESQVTETEEGTVVVCVSAGNVGVPVSTPCDRALSFWQNDTTMAGGGTLFEWTGEAFSVVDERWDDDYGRESFAYFKREYGVEAHPPLRSFDR